MNSTTYQEIGGPRVVPNRRSGWHVTKVVLRCISILLCYAVIAVEVLTIVQSEKSDYGVAFIAYYASPPAILAIVWDKIEIITLCVRRGRGIHPGAHVGVELILWLTSYTMGALIIVAAYGVDLAVVQVNNTSDPDGFDDTSYDDYDDYNDYGDYGDNGYNDYDAGDVQSLSGYVTKARIAGALLFLIATLRFILFVRACVETHRRRKARHTMPSIVTTHYEPHTAIPLGGMGAPQLYDPVAPMPSQAPPQYFDYSKPPPQVSVAPYPQQYHPSRPY